MHCTICSTVFKQSSVSSTFFNLLKKNELHAPEMGKLLSKSNFR
jgi:hypothetical protein